MLVCLRGPGETELQGAAPSQSGDNWDPQSLQGLEMALRGPGVVLKFGGPWEAAQGSTSTGGLGYTKQGTPEG